MKHARRLTAQILTKRRNWYADPSPETTEEPPPTPAPAKGKPATISPDIQEEMNKIAGKARLEGKEVGKTEAMTELLSKLGYEKLEDAEADLKAQREAREAAKTEKEKLEERALKAEKAAQEAEEKRLAVEQERLMEKRDNAIIKAFEKARASNPDDLLILMNAKKPDLVKAIIKDGAVDEKAIQSLISAAKDAYKSSFVGTGPGIVSNAGGRTSSQNQPVLTRKVIG